MASHVVAAVEEIPPGQRKLVAVSGRNIVVFNLGGEFFALNNRCPHRGGSLCQGNLTGLVLSDEPGEYNYSRRGRRMKPSLPRFDDPFSNVLPAGVAPVGRS